MKRNPKEKGFGGKKTDMDFVFFLPIFANKKLALWLLF
jgi:hypothetical protein